MPGLETASRGVGDLDVAWAAHARAPVDVAGDDRGATVIWGDAMAGPDSQRMRAMDLREARRSRGGGAGEPLDGFHAAVDYDVEGWLLVSADLLGTFPIYYWSSREVLLVGSSAAPFRLHPEFELALDHRGLVGILLVQHIVGGRTLLRGVKRLAPGHVLTWSRGGDPRESAQYELPTPSEPQDHSLWVHAGLLDDALQEAVSRHLPGSDPCALLLSGGRDSRMLAGYLAEQEREVETLTLGLRGDVDAQLARSVARRLGMANRLRKDSLEEFRSYAMLQAHWEQLANGLSTVDGWGFHPHLGELPPQVATGFVGGVGGANISWAYEPGSPRMSFEALFSRINAWGIPPAGVRRLLPEVAGDLVDVVIEELRATYESYSKVEWQRAWCFHLHHRDRFQAGGFLWRLCFGSWPVQPVVDRRVQAAAAAMPAAALADRVVQDTLLLRRFPELAAIPDDVNLMPVLPTRRGILEAARWRARTRVRDRLWKNERSRFVRIYDINHPGWRAVRQEAERHRKAAHEFLDGRALAELLPRPEVPIRVRDPIVDTAGAKCLLGFLLWQGEFLGSGSPR